MATSIKSFLLRAWPTSSVNEHIDEESEDLKEKLKQAVIQAKEMFKELHDSNERFESATRMLPVTYCELDTENRFTYVNDTGLRIFGFNKDEVIGKSCLDLLPMEYHSLHLHRLDNLKKGKCNPPINCKMSKKNGELIDCIIQSSPILKDFKMVGSRCVINDISALIRKDEELQRLKEHNEILAVLESVNQNPFLANTLYMEASKSIDPMLLDSFKDRLVTTGFLPAA
jgi:PAS domain S-box-containing protein